MPRLSRRSSRNIRRDTLGPPHILGDGHQSSWALISGPKSFFPQGKIKNPYPASFNFNPTAKQPIVVFKHCVPVVEKTFGITLQSKGYAYGHRFSHDRSLHDCSRLDFQFAGFKRLGRQEQCRCCRSSAVCPLLDIQLLQVYTDWAVSVRTCPPSCLRPRNNSTASC